MVRSGRDSHRWRRRLLDVRHHLHALSSAPPAAAATAACARQQNEQAGREPTNQRQSSSSKKKPEPANNSDEEDEDYGTPLWESDNELYREPSLLPSSAAAVHLPSASLPSPSQAGGGSRAVLITGANRGIGLEFVRQYSQQPTAARVFACCRHPEAAHELVALAADTADEAASKNARVTVHALDVTSQESVAALAAELRGVAIDCLINNAAVNPDLGVQEWDSEIDYGAWHATMNVNVYGVMRVCKALVPNLLLSSQRKLIHISSRAGSVGSQTIEAGRRGMFIYRSSKAALNMVAKLLDVELAPTHGVLSLVIHPGHVVTDMGGEGAPLSALESVRAMVRCIEQLDAPRDGDSNVRFVWYDGRSLCW